MNPRSLRPGVTSAFVAVMTGFLPVGVQAGRPEPVSERAERGRVAVTVSGPEFARPGTYYVGQDASLDDLFARAGVKDIKFFTGVRIRREREGKWTVFRVPPRSLDLQFDFQEGDRVVCAQEIY